MTFIKRIVNCQIYPFSSRLQQRAEVSYYSQPHIAVYIVFYFTQIYEKLRKIIWILTKKFIYFKILDMMHILITNQISSINNLKLLAQYSTEKWKNTKKNRLNNSNSSGHLKCIVRNIGKSLHNFRRTWRMSLVKVYSSSIFVVIVVGCFWIAMPFCICMQFSFTSNSKISSHLIPIRESTHTHTHSWIHREQECNWIHLLYFLQISSTHWH